MIVHKLILVACILGSLAPVGFAQSQLGFSLSQQTESLDLHQAIQIATQNNPQVQFLLKRKAIADAEVRIAQEFNNPSIILETTRSEPKYFAGAGYIFELGGKRGKRIQVARSASDVAEFEYRIGLFTLRHDVRVAYYDALLSHSKRNEVAVSRDLTQRLLEITQQRFELGDVARLEVLTAELEVKKRENELRLAETDEKAALYKLNALLNRPPQDNFTLTGTIEDLAAAPPLESIVEQASSKHLDLQSLQQQIKGEEANLALARAGRIPDLEAEAGSEIHDAAFEYGWRIGLRFEFPLFNRRKGEILRSTATLDSLKAQSLVTAQKIRADVASAYMKYQAALFQAENYRKDILPASTELAELAEESYKEGRTGILSVLEAQRTARQVRLEYLDVLLQYQTAVADLELASGVELP